MCNDNVAFLTQKLFSSDDFSIITHEQEKTQVAFTEKPQIKINIYIIQDKKNLFALSKKY